MADYLTFPSCPPVFKQGGWGVGGCAGLSLQLRFCSASLLQWLNGARISKPTGDKWPTSLSMSFQYNLGINYTNWYCTVINIHLCWSLYARECVRVCVKFVECITLTRQIVKCLHCTGTQWTDFIFKANFANKMHLACLKGQECPILICTVSFQCDRLL